MCFLAAFLREISAELLKTLGTPGMSVPGPAWGSGRSFHCFFWAQKDSAGAWPSLFWPCLFWFLLMQGQNCSPRSGQSKQRCCHLAAALGRRCCLQGWDPISAQRVKFLLPIHDTVCLPFWKPREHQQICWQQNLMATFFPSAKFSIGAVCLGHTCQPGLAPAESTGHCWPSGALAGLLNS